MSVFTVYYMFEPNSHQGKKLYSTYKEGKLTFDVILTVHCR